MVLSEECRLAFEAALDLIKEKCGLSSSSGGQVKIEEIKASLEIPAEVKEILSHNPELTREQKIAAIAESAWARGWGRGMCELVSPGLTGAAKEECEKRMARLLAERVVGK